MFKRVFLFLLINFAVMAVLMAVAHFSGLNEYVNQLGGYTGLAVFCLFWGMGGSVISLLVSRWVAKKFMGVKLVSPTGPYGEIVRTVHALARKAGLNEMPEVGVYEGQEVNAFATGPTRNRSLVAVSSGLLHNMGKDEVDGVLAHEVAHIANGDMVTMTLIQGVVNAFVMFLTQIIMMVLRNATRGDNDRSPLDGFGGFFIRQIIYSLVFFLASPIIMGFSRWREYRADYGGAQLAGKQKMLSALQGLQRSYPLLGKEDSAAAATMQISSKGRFAEWFSSHPPLEKRIAALQGM